MGKLISDLRGRFGSLKPFLRLRGKGRLPKRQSPDVGLRDIRSGLPALAGTLETVMEAAEPRFLRLGGELQTLYADAGQLAQLTMKTAASVAGENEDGFLRHMDRLVKQARAELEGYQAEITDSLRNVALSSGHLGKLCSLCSTIEKTGLSLNVIGLNIAVESSRSAESGQMFSVFTDEIRLLSGKIADISGRILADSSTTRSGQERAHQEIREGLKAFGRLNESADRVVREAVQEVHQIMTLARQALERSNTLSEEISQQVGEVVVAIQFHDIARQKIEHIVCALRDAEALLTRGEERGENRERRWGEAFGILELQAIQLKEVIADIRAAHEKSNRAFEAIDGQVGALVADISVFDPEKDGESHLQQHLSFLESGLEQLRNLLGQGHELERQLKKTAGQVAETASQLSAHIDQVRGISLELHLKALNAIVKSARLDEKGRALEILAQEVSRLSGESGGFVAEVVDILQSLTGLASELDRMAYEGAGQEDSAEVEKGIVNISKHYNTFRTDAFIALKQSRGLQSEIGQVGADLGFLTDLADELTRYLDQLKKMVHGLSPWAIRDGKGAEEIRQVARRYTMESERYLHRLHTGEAAPDPEPGTSSLPASSEADEDFGDNVELF